MNKLPIAVAGIIAIIATSTRLAYAEPSGEIAPATNDAVHYCRTLLGEEEQLIYDALLICALSEDPSAKGPEFPITTDPASDEFKTAFYRCYNALLFDHPELFWLSSGDNTFQYIYRRPLLGKGTYSISLKLTGSFSDIDAQMQALDSAAQAFLSEIDLSASAPQVALAIHDKLIDLVSYDKEAASTKNKDLAHTAYGALIANSRGEANCAVCDGYSYAYEYLLQKAGIRSTIITGLAGDDEASAFPHSWNLVELGGEWYEVDATWNDISAADALDTDADYSAIAQEAINSDWYSGRLTHYLFNVTTEQISDFEPDEYYNYVNDQGWVSFLSSSVHIRHTSQDSADSGDYMTPLAPIAKGTKYSYENLIAQQ